MGIWFREKGGTERYSLVGPESARAVAEGWSEAQWFRSDIARKRMKELMRRSDLPAIRTTAIWLGLLIATAVAGSLLFPSWLALPLFLAYGVLYGSAGDSRWHETGHGTPFKTRWMNNVVYQLASFMMMRDPTVWRWNHTRHHTDTLIVGRDPEILIMRPARLMRLLANLFGLVDVPLALYGMVLHSFGRLNAEECETVPETERHKVVTTARVWVVIYAATIATCVLTRSILPALLVGGPRIYGTFMQVLYGLTQHAGMGENVLDHRLNTRTVYMNRVNRFLYWNMNYHVEHHMYPMVPSHRLPALHEEIKHDLAAPYPSMWAAFKEIVPAVLRQCRDETYYIRRELPAGAAPYSGPVPEPVAA